MAVKTRKRHREAFKHQFEVVNILSGHTVTFHDDGCAKGGGPNHQRTHVIKKLNDCFDPDGDPVFVLPGPPPEWMLDDEHDGRAMLKLSRMFRTLDDPAKGGKFKTLRDKADANRKAREAAEKKAAESGIFGGGALPPMIQQFADSIAASVSKGGKGKATA